MTTQKKLIAKHSDPITLGRLGRPYGVRGWAHLYSLMIPESLILEQSQCVLQLGNRSQECRIEQIKPHGKNFVTKIDCIPTRESVSEWTNALLIADRSQLPELSESDYYITDLIGHEVQNTDGVILGTVSDIMQTGANDVFIVDMPSDKETLIPHIPNVIKSIDHEQKLIIADWVPL